MYRSVVALFLLPSVLLTQLAAVGHSHYDSQPAGHDLRPHFHTGRAAPHHGQGHHHHGDHHHGPGSHHHHHDDADHAAESGTAPIVQPNPLSEDHHDSDAIFLDRIDVVVNNYFAGGIEASHTWVAVWPNLSAERPAKPAREAVFQTHGPPTGGHHCPIYLWQLTLLV
jgi:hypothetical protein